MEMAEVDVINTLRRFIKPCAIVHLNEGACPECGDHHRVLTSLPGRPLDPYSIEDLAEGVGVIIPNHKLDIEHPALAPVPLKLIPSMVIARKNSVVATEYSPDYGWVVVEEYRDVEDSIELAESVSDRIRMSAVDKVPDIPSYDLNANE